MQKPLPFDLQLCEAQDLPFTVRPVTSDALREKVALGRSLVYARHTPELAAQFNVPEPDDSAPDCQLLVALDKRSGAYLGSIRSRFNESRPLSLEAHMDLPAGLQVLRLAETRRFNVVPGPQAALVRDALIQANLMCLVNRATQWCLAVTKPQLLRLYQGLMFEDVVAGRTFTPLPLPNVPHRVLGLNVETVHQRWLQAQHPRLGFFFQTRHPDICVGR